MSKKEKRILAFLAVTALTLGVAPRAEAMHIMEGYLPGGYCIAWGVLCLPFLAAGFFAIRKTLQERRNLITLLAMSGAFIFVISSLKIPSVTGSCSHMTGTGLGAILFGPAAVSVLGLIVLLFQALLLGHGGLTTIGANTFSMAIAGPFVSWGIYLLCRKLKVNKRAGIFLAATLGDLVTYCVTALQMALVHNADILSNIDLAALYHKHLDSHADATLAVSHRQTSRYLLLDQDYRLHGWLNKQTGETRPEGFDCNPTLYQEYAFGGIHVVSHSLFPLMEAGGWQGKFSIIPFYLSVSSQAVIQRYPFKP